MPVPSAADIRRRLSAFAKEWASAHSKAADAKTFWLRALGGRLKSDYRYSASIVYNNFPWPDPSEAQRAAIDAAGQAILDARAGYPDATLADVYDPLTMPAELRKAHQANDRAVDAAYGYRATALMRRAWRFCSACISNAPACCPPRRTKAGAERRPGWAECLNKNSVGNSRGCGRRQESNILYSCGLQRRRARKDPQNDPRLTFWGCRRSTVFG